MYDNKSAVDALAKGLNDLEDLFQTLQEKYDEDFAKGQYEQVVEEELDWDEIRAKAQAVRSFGRRCDSNDTDMETSFSKSQNKEAKAQEAARSGR